MLAKDLLSRVIRRHVLRELYDDSGAPPLGTAIYSLADPRDLRLTRYIGQSAAPRRRFLQHLNTARLWMPDEVPWWVRQPRLRPLYAWLRALYREEERLPTMIIHVWVDGTRAAREAERAWIHAALARQLPLLNFESENPGGQISLI
jgi:hypothetical protein